MIGTTLGQQGFELLEDGLDEVRWECGHGFSPSSGSLEDSPDDRASRVRFPSSGPSHLSAQALSLRFNYEGFCEGLYSIAKPFAFAQFVASGGRFDGRVALGPAGEPPSGSPRRPTAGFRRLRWHAHLRQKRRNYPVHPHGRKATRLVAPLPRQPKIRNTSPRQPQLGVGGHHQPRPPIRLLGVANPGRGPSHALLEEAERVFEVEAPDVGAPEEIELRRRPLRTVPPKPQDSRLAPPFAPRQTLDLHQN